MYISKPIQKFVIFSLILILRLTGLPGLLPDLTEPIFADEKKKDELKKPVFYLKYLYGQGFTEEESTSDEDPDELAAATNKHTASLRIKEQFSKQLLTNLFFNFTRQDYLLTNSSYNAFYLLPDFTYEFTDQFDLYAGFKFKWKYYDEPDSSGYAKDFFNLALKTKLIFKPLKQLALTPFIYSNFNLNKNSLAAAQYYDFGLLLTSKWDNITLGGRYKGQASFPLGAESLVNTRLANEFGINLTWDPN